MIESLRCERVMHQSIRCAVASLIITLICSGSALAVSMFFDKAGGNIIVSNNNVAVYGNTANDSVTITPGITGVFLDQNIDRINFSGASKSYAFLQTGNVINIYDATGAAIIVSAIVQGDSDGTLLSFSDGTAAALLKKGVMTLGGATVSSGKAGTLAPVMTIVP